jgi:uncharacterized coiled-coil protein SlyX
MDERLVDLETRLAFQEDSLRALHLAVARQQQSIERLHQELRQLRQQLLATGPGDADTPPY